MKGDPQRPVIPEVEELSDLQWARIERGLWSKLDAGVGAEAAPVGPARAASSWRLRGLAIGGALAVAAVALLALFWRGPRAPHGPTAQLGAEVPSRVMTHDSATTLSFADAAIEVAPHSALLLSGSVERGATVVLEGGKAAFRVSPRTQPFMVVAGHAAVRVVGTQFQVERKGEEISVRVAEGKVAVHYLGHVHQLMAGQAWSSASVAPVQTVLLDAQPAPQGEPPPPQDRAPAAQPQPPADAPHRPPHRRGDPHPSDPPPVIAPPPVVAPPSPPDDGARAQFADAARLESSEPNEALRRYLALSRRDDRWGANALFAAARLALDVGQRARAAELAQAYLRRFPAGSNAADAKALLEVVP